MGIVSDVTALTAPPPGWYPDRNEANLVRWWDGQQWTDHTKSTAPAAAAFEQPTAAAAFGTGLQYGQRDASLAPTVNSLATRGMVYSLVALVINPLLILGIGGLVNGIKSLRRVSQFAPENARKGQAIAAIVVGAFATLMSIGLLIVAVLIPVLHGLGPHVFDREGAQSHLAAELSAGHPAGSVASVSCPPDTAMHDGDTFDCMAALGDGGALPIHVTIHVDNGVYTYAWKVDWTEATGPSQSDSPLFQTDHAATGVPYTLDVITQNTATDLSSHYGLAVTKIDCDSDASVARGAFFECVVTFADASTARIQIKMSNGLDGGYNLMVLNPPAGGG